MGKSCTILAHVRNSKGEIVESRLFKDLLSYLDSRSLAKEYYYVGTDKGFLDRVRDKAKFDENGEITFSSLKRLAKINVKQERELEVLNKNIKAGVYSYEDAISKVVDFNRNNDLNDNYMATIVKEGNKYRLSVIPRTKSKEAELERTVQDRSLRDRIIYHLNKAGVSVEFLENDDKVEGRYSTINAEKTADGLYQLIQVANGKKATATLAEEAGHFAIGALGNSPLVERLMKILTPEVQKKILGEETYEEKYLGTNAAREVAGTLVGRAIMNNVDLKSPWGRLASRIFDLAKRVFATISGNDILKARIEAQSMARSIARGFMSQEQQGDIELPRRCNRP